MYSSAGNTEQHNLALLVGGPDVDGRIPLMQRLNGFDLAAVGSSPSLASQFAKAGYSYHTYPLNRGANPLADVRTLLVLARLFRRLQPVLVHTFDTKPGVWGRLAAWLARVPIIIGTLPGLGSLYTANGASTRLVGALYQPLQKLACTVSDLTIFQNQDDAYLFIDSGIVKRSKTEIMPGSGVNTHFFDPALISDNERKAVRTELGLRPDALLVTMVARLIRSKGVLDFASAAQSVQKEYEHVAFLLVGPHDRESVDALSAAELTQLREKVIWPGPRSDIRTILAATDIFILPTKYREGVPRVLLEAAAMALPIVTTDVPGCREIVREGQNGYLVAAGDTSALSVAIGRLIDSPETRRQFGPASRLLAATAFELETIVQQTSAIYRNLLTTKGLIPTEGVL